MIKRPTNKQLNQLIHQVELTEDIDCTSSIMNLIECGKLEMRSRWVVLTEYFGPSRAMIGEVIYCTQNDLVIQTPAMEIVTVKMHQKTVEDRIECPEPLRVIKMVGKRDGDVFWASRIRVSNQKAVRMVRDKGDCIDKERWQHKNDVVQRRRQVAEQPMLPHVGTVQLIRSIR